MKDMNNVKETGIITEVDRYLFGEGTHYEVYKKLGAHVMELNGVKGVYFAVWAPKAKNVSVVGNFNGWMGYKLILGFLNYLCLNSQKENFINLQLLL